MHWILQFFVSVISHVSAPLYRNLPRYFLDGSQGKRVTHANEILQELTTAGLKTLEISRCEVCDPAAQTCANQLRL
jgi:hypothetical protein